MDFNLSFNLENSINNTRRDTQNKLYDLLIIGAGPAGLNAALYAKRKGLEVAVLSKKKGGQILDTSSVDNYLGIDEVTGEELVNKFLRHLSSLDVPMIDNGEVVDYFSENSVHNIVTALGETYKGKTILIATGSNPRHLSVPGEMEFVGKGVSYCAICDGPLFRNKDVFIAGGGNSAIEAALDMAKLAASVTLVHRSELRADKILVDKLYENPKIKVLLQTRITEITGNAVMEGLKLQSNETNEIYTLKGSGIFIEIGHIPNTTTLGKILELNEKGEIITDTKKKTNIPGIFAAGDVTDTPYKQIIVSAAEGAIAALAVNDYLNQNRF